MLIIGAGGLTRDVITSWELDENTKSKSLFLFDNINPSQKLLYNKYPIYHTFDEVKKHFETIDRKFFVCIGNPLKRKRMTEQIEALGGELTPFVSCKVLTLSPATPLGKGAVIEPGVGISRDVIIERGVFINAGTILGHDVILREYVSLGPGVRVLGGAEIGECSYIGCNAVIMPKVKIGKKVRIGVGKVIDKDVPDNSKII
ncbi:MAG: UDP-3-O-(3-hydroxymyristoyl)glucosamine N-acyltransferase [Bacteroidia bacterium]|nr:UDP-3-O-(3-hydroxymyristoyl)glucosamine N-acyltransferase [Bacteroidia bacterium]